MKFIYITSKKYPSSKVDPVFVRSMAEAYSDMLGNNFLFLMRGKIPEDFNHMNVKSVCFPRRLRVLFYFFWFPFFGFKNSNPKTVFISYDPYLSVIIIFWKKIFGFKYFLCTDWHQLFGDWRDSFIALNSDWLSCTSRRLKGFLILKCKADPRKTFVAYGGINPEPFEKKINNSGLLRKKLGLPEDSFLVGYVGGFRSMIHLRKGLDIMIKALLFLDKEIKMVFVGGSEEEIEEYQNLAKQEGVFDRCLFFKKQPFDKVIDYELSLDVLVIPYPNKRHFRDYGFPMKVWEYLASGRPIIYSNLEIIDEALRSYGFSFEPDNSKDLARVVVNIFSDFENVKIKSSKNSQYVYKYTWQSRANRILDYIQKEYFHE